LDEQQLRDIMLSGPTADDIDIRGRLTNLKKTANLQLAKEYFEREEGRSLAPPIVIIKLDNLLREFILGKADDKFVDEEPSENEKSAPRIIDIYEFRQQDNKEGFVPLYTLRAACGYFEDGEVPEEEGWVDASGNGFTPDPKRHFAVHAKGDSMLDMIKDGDICVFEWYRAGSRNGEIVLTECSEKDLDYGGMYTIKKYHSEKVVTEEGWQHSKVELIPLNKDFDVIELDEENEYRTIGVLKCVLSNE
jgi:SOS-response transcriptional repressor LexA